MKVYITSFESETKVFVKLDHCYMWLSRLLNEKLIANPDESAFEWAHFSNILIILIESKKYDLVNFINKKYGLSFKIRESELIGHILD